MVFCIIYRLVGNFVRIYLEGFAIFFVISVEVI